ncbi:unnamed protein product [Caenorhabditis nigoni]
MFLYPLFSAIASESKRVSSVKTSIKRGESVHSISNLLDVRLDKNGDMEFLVKSNGNSENSWRPMSNFLGGEESNEAISDFLNLERNRRKYEDLKLEVVRIKARTLRKSGNSKNLKNLNPPEKPSEESEDLKIDEVVEESRTENSEKQEVQEIVKFLVEKIEIESKRWKSEIQEDCPIEILRSGDQDSDILVFKDSEDTNLQNILLIGLQKKQKVQNQSLLKLQLSRILFLKAQKFRIFQKDFRIC